MHVSEVNTGIEAFDESEDLGLFLAHLRHYLSAITLSTLTRKSLVTTPADGTTKPVVWVNGVLGTSQAGELDRLVVQAKSLTDLWFYVSGMTHPPYRFWDSWRADTEVAVKELAALPERDQRLRVWGDLHYAYVEEYERLMRRVGPDELCVMAGLSDKELHAANRRREVPPPVERVSGVPLWTVGQAEVFAWEQNNSSDRPSWTLRRQSYAVSREVTFDTEGDAEDAIGYFHNSGYRFVGFVNIDDTRIQDEIVDRIVQFTVKRVPVHPEVDEQLGHRRLYQERWMEAEQHLQDALDLYDALIPEDFCGLLDRDGCEEYWFASVYLAFLKYRTGDVDEALEMLQELQDRFNEGDLTEELEELRNRPESFGHWFQQTYLRPWWMDFPSADVG